VSFPLKTGTRQRCPLSPLLFNILLDIFAKDYCSLLLTGSKKKKRIQIGKKVVKLFLFADDIIFYTKDPKNS
jgi:hypothetical protein